MAKQEQKRGPGAPKSDNPKDQTIHIRCTAEDKATLADLAEEAGDVYNGAPSVGAYLLRVGLGG